MNASWSSFFDWLLRASFQAAILALLVLAAQYCLRKRLDGRWRYLLWLLVLARLALPFSPPSPASLFNYVRLEAVANPMPVKPIPTPATHFEAATKFAAAPSSNPALETPVRAPALGESESQANGQNSEPTRARFAAPGWRLICALIWAAGAAVLILRVVLQNALFCRRLRRGRATTDPQTLELFQKCQSLMGVRASVHLMETDAVRSPALYGLFRPRLLLPAGLTARFNAAELRHIFLHELAHIRRRDMLAQWLVMGFQIAHWFNPVLWFAFRRMSADRELACDELALSIAGEAEGRSYGKTMVKLLETCSQPPALPGLVGILEDKNQMFQRISMIARFKQHPRWSITGAVLVAVLAVATLTGAQTEKALASRPRDLIGHVERADGQPVKGTIFISTAGPREGTSPICPSCYPDCRKSAKTDSQGNFKIESLDPGLLFRILVAGEGCQPKFVDNIDPAKEPIKVSLEPQDPARAPPEQTVRGHITDAKGAPIEGAAVDAFRVHAREGDGIGRLNRGAADRLAVSDAHGDFIITGREPFVSLDLRIEARGFSKRTFMGVRGGGPAHELQLTEGATIKGRVTLDGKPLANVSVGAISEDTSIEHYTGIFDVGTDAEGRFAFLNLPPNVRYHVYGLMKTLNEHGATRTMTVATGGDGSVTDAGELAVGPAYRISGRVVLEDGKEIPPKTRLLVSHKDPPESMLIDLDKDGSFNAGGIPSGEIDLSVSVAGYHPSFKNAGLDTLNPFGLIGLVQHDITNLVILMDKGEHLKSYFGGSANGMDLPENRPLEGAEHAEDLTRHRIISGRVTDKQTGEPIANFRLTPGSSGGFREPAWNPQRALDGTNGTYVIYLSKDDDAPALEIEAPGYLPMATWELTPNQTSYDFAMTKGSGPSGVVLLPDGTPAGDATVLLIRPQNDGDWLLGLVGGGKFQSDRNQRLLAKTDSTGHFSLAPAFDVNSVAASAPEGFKMVSIETLKTNAQIKLEPWGSVKGVLRRANRLSTNENLSLHFAKSSSRGDFFLAIGAITDEKGEFKFDNVPAGECEISGFIPWEFGGGSSPEPLQEVRVSPGQTAEVSIAAPEKRLELGKGLGQTVAGQRAMNVRHSKPLQGVVLLPNGKPAANAQVGLKADMEMLYFGDGELVADTMDPSIGRTDDKGEFTLSMPASVHALYVAHEGGYAKMEAGELTNGIKVSLQPWGKVEGTLKLNNRPGANERIMLESTDPDEPGWPWIYLINLVTDEHGGFAICHVPAGQYTLSLRIKFGRSGWTTSHGTQFEIHSSETTNIAWGGNGRPVIGKLDLTAVKDLPSDTDIMVAIQGPGPSGIVVVSREFRQKHQSEAGYEAIRNFRYYTASSSADGVFQIDDVPPGKYQMTFDFPGWRARQGTPKPVSLKSEEITVPPPADAVKREPYDLGLIKPEPAPAQPLQPIRAQPLKAGDTAPDFETVTLEEKPLRLADYRGKFVLLDLRFLFPAMEREGLESANDSFGKDDRFVMISLCQQANDDYVKQLKSKGSHWVVGEIDFNKMAELYGFNGANSPMILLIGPDGKILEVPLHGERIHDAVAEALAHK